MFLRPTQSTPGGFLFVFFGVLFLIASGLSGYAGFLVFRREVIDQIETAYSYEALFIWSAFSGMIALLLIFWGIKLALAVAPYDTHDPKQPTLKF